MKKMFINIISLFLVYSCNNSNWETIEGIGIDEGAKSIDNAIYFENENKGVVGGYELVTDPNAKNDFKMSEIPILYLTEDGGKNWKKIHIDKTIKQNIQNAYLHFDTLICETESLVLLSVNKGGSIQSISDSSQRNLLIKKYLKTNNLENGRNFLLYQGTKYIISERYQNEFASALICYGPELMTDYYFVSFDKGMTWSFLQKDFSDNRKKFLVGAKFLYRYYFPFGLQRLKLK
jgi:hypothetical protein